jgi:protein-S-isoprenylcysteine O-methyltransferase Ste14
MKVEASEDGSGGGLIPCFFQRQLTNPTTMPDGTNLKVRLVRRTLLSLILLPAVLFWAAGTLKFWQGWAFLVLSLGFPIGMTVYFYKRDPEMLARRMLIREKVSAQKIIMLLLRLLYLYALIFAGWDYRSGWTRTNTGPVPWWLTLLALAIILGCNFWFVSVMKANRFAASIIQVEAGQTIAAAGPYRLVRHPMYLGVIVTWLATPLALGSEVTLPVFALIIPIIIFRLLNEENMLRRELPGYAEYCRHNRCRLIPFVW